MPLRSRGDLCHHDKDESNKDPREPVGEKGCMADLGYLKERNRRAIIFEVRGIFHLEPQSRKLFVQRTPPAAGHDLAYKIQCGKAFLIVAVDEKIDKVYVIQHPFDSRNVAVVVVPPLSEGGLTILILQDDATFTIDDRRPEQRRGRSDNLNIGVGRDVIPQRQ